MNLDHSAQPRPGSTSVPPARAYIAGRCAACGRVIWRRPQDFGWRHVDGRVR